MAQISDVVHASTIFDAARQELAWAYSGDFADVPEPMKGAVHTISEVLNQAEMRWVTSTTAVAESQQIQDWLMRLKVVAYDMRAVARKELLQDWRIDDKLSARWLPCVPRATKTARKTANIDAVTAKLEELKKEYERFGYTTGLPLATTCMQELCVDGKEDTTVVTADVPLVGRDDDKNMIIDYITANIGDKGDEDQPIIIPIVGAPCVGKTALVKSVIQDPRFQDDCYVKVWVDMGKGWDTPFGNYIIIKASDGEKSLEGLILDTLGEHRYSVSLRDMLLFRKKQLLLVFDDMVDLECSNEDKQSHMLHALKGFLYENRSYVVTIVTTRSQAVAEKMSTTLHPYRLHPFSDDSMYWEIIKRTGGLQARTGGNEAAALPEIASKCSGLPLAAKVLGRFLQSVNPQEWPRARDFWNFRGGFSRDSQLPIHSTIIFTHLKRSNHLDTESWLSFAYCAFFVFPKAKGGHGIITRDLINQWCSLRITTSERGWSCILQLLDRSLLLLRENKPNSTVAESFVTMEDLMHDFARYLLGDRLIVVDGRNGSTPPSSSSSPVNNNKNSSNAYLALVSNLDANQAAVVSNILPAGILALRFVDCREMELSAGEFASAAKYSHLRLLDLSGCTVRKLPHSIRHLKQLRYLNAPGIQEGEEFPRPITWLHELRYLNLAGSRGLSSLTEAFQRLVNLRDMNLSGCSGLQALPDSFGRLWRLERLDLSACSGIESLPGSFCWLKHLRYLDMSGCSGLKALPDAFGTLNLWRLDLSRCSRLEYLPWSMERMCWLEHLNLSGSPRLETLAMRSLPMKLRELNLSGCTGLVELPDASKYLRHLDLSGCRSLGTMLPSSYSELQNLEHLNLSACSVVRLPEVGGDDQLWTKQLVHLDLSYCWWLQEMPAAHWLQNLQFLDLSGCFQLQVPYGLVDSVRSRGRATGPEDASLSAVGTNGTINLSRSHSICDGDPMFRPSPDYLDMLQKLKFKCSSQVRGIAL